MKESKKNNLLLRMIKDKCKTDGVTLKKLCHGICDTAYISRCISNNTEVDKLMLDAFIQRLGITTSNYMYILRDSEYECFAFREKTRVCIQNGNLKEANELLESYLGMQKKMKGAKKLHYQITLLLRSYVLEKEDADVNVQMQNVEEAIACTMEGVPMAHLDEFLFTEVELLLLLRKAMLLEKIGKEQDAYELYNSLYQLGRTKIYFEKLTYIFIVVGYHLAKMHLIRKEYYFAQRLVEECIKTLSTGNQFLFLAELLEMEEKLNPVQGKVRREHELIKKFVLKYLPDWNPDTYVPMYQEFSVYPFRKIAIQRRKLLGLTQEELSEKCHCDVATIERMEQGKMDTQSSIAYEIRNVLKIPMEKGFYSLQTSDYKVIKGMYSELMDAVNQKRTEEAKELLDRLSVSIDDSLVINYQLIEFYRCVIRHIEKNISMEDRIDNFMKVLSLTLPKERLHESSEVILYSNERMLIHNIALCYEELGESEFALQLLEFANSGYLPKNNVGEESIKYYLTTLRDIESISANMGNFIKANEILEESIVLAVKYNFTGVVMMLMYDKFWNILEEDASAKADWEMQAVYEISKFHKDRLAVSYIKELFDKMS